MYVFPPKNWFSILLAFTIYFVTVPGQTQQMPSLRVGLIGPFSGPSADYGISMQNGVRLAIDEINSVGGYLGRTIELIIKDDQGNPEVGQRVSNEIVNEPGLVAALGFCNTGVALHSIDVFQAKQVPLIVPCATGTPVTTKFPTKDSYIFRASARDAIEAPFLIDDILRRGWYRVAVFADTTAYGNAGIIDVRRALNARNIQAVHEVRFAPGVKDLTSELEIARAAGAQVIVSYTIGHENALIARNRHAMKWKVPLAGPWTLSSPNFIEGAKEAADGALTVQSFIAEPSNERRATFLAAYGKRFGSEQRFTMPMVAAQSYDATYLLAYALLGIRSGQIDGSMVKTALERSNRTYYGVIATYEHAFTPEDKEALTSDMLVMGVVRNGKVHFAHLEDARRNLFVRRH